MHLHVYRVWLEAMAASKVSEPLYTQPSKRFRGDSTRTDIISIGEIDVGDHGGNDGGDPTMAMAASINE